MSRFVVEVQDGPAVDTLIRRILSECPEARISTVSESEGSWMMANSREEAQKKYEIEQAQLAAQQQKQAQDAAERAARSKEHISEALEYHETLND